MNSSTPKKPIDKIAKIDIGKEANGLGPDYSDGDLERIDQEKGISFRWFKERTIIWLSALIIGTILLSSLFVLILSKDENTRDWAMQSLTVLLGFAAGAIWSSSKSNGN